MAVTNVDSTMTVLHEIAAQAYALAMGLQNAAPIQTGGLPRSVQYLLEASLQIEKTRKQIEEMLLTDSSKTRP